MRYRAIIDSRQISIEDVDLAAGRASVDGRPVNFDFQPVRPGLFSLILHNRVYTVHVEGGKGLDEISIGGYHARVVVEDERTMLMRQLAHADEDSGPFEVNAPMPGLVVRLHVQVGDHIHKGQRLVTIEAMKMENEIKSSGEGLVEQVFVAEQKVVEKGARLLRLSKVTFTSN